MSKYRDQIQREEDYCDAIASHTSISLMAEIIIFSVEPILIISDLQLGCEIGIGGSGGSTIREPHAKTLEF